MKMMKPGAPAKAKPASMSMVYDVPSTTPMGLTISGIWSVISSVWVCCTSPASLFGPCFAASWSQVEAENGRQPDDAFQLACGSQFS